MLQKWRGEATITQTNITSSLDITSCMMSKNEANGEYKRHK